MWKKIIFAVVFVAFAVAQFADSLTCYSCNTPDSCNKPSTQTCNNGTANATSLWLSQIHSNVPIVSGSNNFRCMNLTYFVSPNRNKAYDFKGCYHTSVPVCSLNYNGTQPITNEKNCTICDRDRCNGNPAGTYSKSNFTIIASAMALILTKLLR